jgi:hypothetical protein
MNDEIELVLTEEILARSANYMSVENCLVATAFREQFRIDCSAGGNFVEAGGALYKMLGNGGNDVSRIYGKYREGYVHCNATLPYTLHLQRVP